MKSNELILLVNKGGLEFGKSFRSRLDQNFLCFVCHEDIKGNPPFVKDTVFQFYRKKIEQSILPDNDLKILKNIDRQIFKEMTNDSGYRSLLKSYLSQKTRLLHMLSAYFQQNFSIPTNIHNKNRCLNIYIIADLNNPLDFFMVNGLLYALQDVISNFMSVAVVRAVLLCPEYDTARADRLGKLHAFCQNMNFFHLLKQYVEYNLEVIMCVNVSNAIAWQSFYHFIRFGIFKKTSCNNKSISCIRPFLLPAVTPDKKSKFLNSIHDSIIAGYLLACSTKLPAENDELMSSCNRLIDENINTLFLQNKKDILYRFKHDPAFSDFADFLKSFVSDSAKADTDFIDTVKDNYINGFLSFDQIKKFIKSAEDDSLEINRKEIKTDFLTIKKQFEFIRQRSLFMIIKDKLTGGYLLPNKEIKSLISFYYKTISISMHKRKLAGLAAKILRYSTDSDAPLYSSFCADRQFNERLAGFVKNRYLDDIDLFKLKKDVLDASGKIYFQNEDAKKQIYNYFDKQIIEKFLSDLNAGQAFIKIWKEYVFPLAQKINISMFAVGQNKNILDYIDAEPCSGVNNISAQFAGNPKKSRLNVISKNVDCEAHNGIIYYKIGEFQLSSIFFKGYEYFFKEEFINLKQIRDAIKNLDELNLAAVLKPDEKKILKIEKGFDEIKNTFSSFRNMDLKQIKTVLQDDFYLDQQNKYIIDAMLESLCIIERPDNIRGF